MVRTLFASALALLASTDTVFAQEHGRDATDFVGGLLGGVTGSNLFGDIAVEIALKSIPIINGVAFLVIVIAGMLAVVAQDENRIATARKVAVMALIGLVLVNIAGKLTQAYLTAFDFGAGVNADAAARIIEIELLGVIAFAEVPIIVLSIVTIMVYGIKAVFDYGGEQGLQAFKKAVLSVLTGYVIIGIRFFVVEALILSGDPQSITNPVYRLIFTLVSYAGILAVIVIAVAGIFMITNLGDENRYQKAKMVIISVGLGLAFMAVIMSLLLILVQALGFSF